MARRNDETLGVLIRFVLMLLITLGAYFAVDLLADYYQWSYPKHDRDRAERKAMMLLALPLLWLWKLFYDHLRDYLSRQ